MQPAVTRERHVESGARAPSAAAAIAQYLQAKNNNTKVIPNRKLCRNRFRNIRNRIRGGGGR